MDHKQAQEELRRLTYFSVRKAIEAGFTAGGLNWMPHTGDHAGIDPKSGEHISWQTYKIGDRLVQITVKVF
jgi:alpha-glucuronidase